MNKGRNYLPANLEEIGSEDQGNDSYFGEQEDSKAYSLQEAYIEVGGMGKLYLLVDGRRKVPVLCICCSMLVFHVRQLHGAVSAVPYPPA